MCRVYVSGLINHSRLPILLDTGATSGVLNRETWKASGLYRPEILQETNAILTAANGDILAVQSRRIITLRLGNSMFEVPMLIVCDIPYAFWDLISSHDMVAESSMI